MSEEERDEGHGRLGRLFAALSVAGTLALLGALWALCVRESRRVLLA